MSSGGRETLRDPRHTERSIPIPTGEDKDIRCIGPPNSEINGLPFGLDLV
jgi:hypothetical protein